MFYGSSTLTVHSEYNLNKSITYYTPTPYEYSINTLLISRLGINNRVGHIARCLMLEGMRGNIWVTKWPNYANSLMVYYNN